MLSPIVARLTCPGVAILDANNGGVNQTGRHVTGLALGAAAD